MAESNPSTSRRCSLATPIGSREMSRRFLYDSGYQSNTPDSIGCQWSAEKSIQIGVPKDGSLYTPEITILKTRTRPISKCMQLKHKPFPISTEETQYIDYDYISDSHNLEEEMFVDDVFMDDDAMNECNDLETESNYQSLYEPIDRTVTESCSMDVEEDNIPTLASSEYFDLNAQDNKYNDEVLEANIQSRKSSLSLSSESGKALLNYRLGVIQQERKEKERTPYHNWRDQLAESGYRVLKDFSVKSTVDFLYYFGKKSDHSVIISKILNYLSPQDLKNVAKVSQTWRNVFLSDTKSQKRLHDFTKPSLEKDVENTKPLYADGLENLYSGNSSKLRASTLYSGPLIHIENYQPAKTEDTSTRSPPVTPSKRRFHSFYKAGCKLKIGDRQTTCPRCNKPAEVNVDTNTGTCKNNSCVHMFCSVCRRAVHLASPCMVLSSPQAKKSKSVLSVGSKQSRRNLRRL